MSPRTREQLTAEVVERTGIDEAMIETVVRAFYDRARKDEMLGPVFASRIDDDEWEPHIALICAFWSSVALMTGTYHGRPMQLHVGLPVDAEHFDRWLALWEQTTREICPPAAADHFIEKAHLIAQSLELGIAMHNGVMVAPGERYRRA